MRHLYIIFILASCSFTSLLSQDFRFDHITSNEYLSDDFVRRVFEDSYGYIWIATKDGLSRFDGYNMKTYHSEEGNKHSLSSSYLADIKEDSNGNLWIGTGNGLSMYDREQDHFEQYITDNSSNNSIYDLEIDGNILWAGTQDGLCKFNIRNKSAEWFLDHESELHTQNYRIARVVKGSNHDLWVGYSHDNGLLRYNTETNNYKQFINNGTDTHSIPNNSITAINVYNDSTIIIGSIEGGVSIFNTKSEQCTPIEAPVAQTVNSFSMPWAIYKDSQQQLWIGSINGGLFLYDSLLRFQKNFVPDESATDGLNSFSVSSIIEDQKGNLWFGTHGGGLDVIFKRKNLFKHYKSSSNKQSIRHNLVSSFYQTDSATLWVGTDGGGLNRINLETGDVSTFSTENGLSSNAILSIQPYSKDTLAISSWDGGIILLNTTTHKSRNFQYKSGKSNSLNYKYTKHVFRKGDSLYISTHSQGINIYNIRNQKFFHSNIDQSYNYLSLPETCNKSLLDSSGNLWVTSTKGLYRIKEGKTYEYLPNKSNPNSILDKYVTDGYVDSKGRLWFGTMKGLNLYNPEDDSFIQFGVHDELHEAIMSIVEDDSGNLWLGSNIGLIRFNMDTGSLTVFNKSDGLQGNLFFERAAYKNSKGTLFFGGMNGFNSFNPKDIHIDSTVPQLYFTDLKIFYEPVKVGGKNKLLTKHINFTDEISLLYSQNIFTIEYIGLHFIAPDKNEYSYTLEGFDNQWYNVANSRKVTYTNLSPGRYVFKLRASNSDKIWTPRSKKLIINILPPWWMTWWFRLSLLAFAFAIIFIIFTIRTRNIKRINRMLEIEVNKRTRELQIANADLQAHKDELQETNSELEANREELLANNDKLKETIDTKDRFFNIIAHDLKNPMNSLLGLSDLLLHHWTRFNEEKKKKFIGQIHSSSEILFGLLLNLLDWSRSQTGKLQVNITATDVKNIVLENTRILNGQAESKSIFLKTFVGDNISALADENMLNTIIRNILSNAIKYTPKNGTIAVIAENNGSEVHVSISDTGVGMTQNQIDSLFKVDVNNSTSGTENEKGTGLGLLVCHEFISKMNGKIDIESEVEKGTTFIISLPQAVEADCLQN